MTFESLMLLLLPPHTVMAGAKLAGTWALGATCYIIYAAIQQHKHPKIIRPINSDDIAAIYGVGLIGGIFIPIIGGALLWAAITFWPYTLTAIILGSAIAILQFRSIKKEAAAEHADFSSK